MNDEKEGMWKWPSPALRYYFGTCLDSLRKTKGTSVRIACASYGSN